MNCLETDFGSIKLNHPSRTRKISIKVDLNGQLKINCPTNYSKRKLQQFIKNNQSQIQALIDHYYQNFSYQDGDKIGKTRLLKIIIDQDTNQPIFKLKQNFLTVFVNSDQQFHQPETQMELKKQIKKALKKDAKAYLTPRINFLAKQSGFEFDRLRFSHNSTNWGSCSPSKTISLNISLMKLPNELIDYVIIHELCHLKHMNHSPAFWSLVESFLPDYKKLKKQLANHSPHL